MMPVRAGGREGDDADADADTDADADAASCKYKSTSHPNSSLRMAFSSPASIVGDTYM
jgi:hypothetical protein